MCFSPEASFGAAVVLFPTGVYCLRAALRRRPRLWAVAVVPCVFGLQQAIEGFVWLGLDAGYEPLVRIAARAYLFFAQAFWPIWFCLAAAVAEPPGRRRRFLTAWATLSLGWLVCYLPVLTNLDERTAHVCHHSIRYDYPDGWLDSPAELWAVRGLYLISATVPYLVYSSRRVTAVPVALCVAAAGVAAVLYDHAFTSVWCLFAAVLSASLAWAFHQSSGRTG